MRWRFRAEVEWVICDSPPKARVSKLWEKWVTPFANAVRVFLRCFAGQALFKLYEQIAWRTVFSLVS